MNLLAFNTVLLVTLIALQQLVVVRDKRSAVRVAQRVAEAATLAAKEASTAGFQVELALKRIEALFGGIESQGGKVLQATIRMEKAAEIIASNLANAQGRATDSMNAEGYEAGSAADQYASQPEEERTA